MILIKGTEPVKDVTINTSVKGTEWANIELGNGLKIATFSATAITAAQVAMAEGKPLAFIGQMKAREWQGKAYPEPQIDNAWVIGDIGAAVVQKQDKGAEDVLPF